jgi:hypothetical protein
MTKVALVSVDAALSPLQSSVCALDAGYSERFVDGEESAVLRPAVAVSVLAEVGAVGNEETILEVADESYSEDVSGVATDVVGGLKQREVKVALQEVSTAETGDAGADDGETGLGHGNERVERTWARRCYERLR